MTKIKLANGTIINAETVEVVKGVLKISTAESTVEELAELFSNKENTCYIVLMTAANVESGYKTGFTSFAGIHYDTDGLKTVELFQPVDVTEKRIADAESMAVMVSEKVAAVEESIAMLEASQEIQDEAIVELADIIAEQEVQLW